MTSNTTAMSSNETYDMLSSLLPSTSYMLAYSLPLLFVSALLTFAGAFLTLDRTHSFPSSNASSDHSSHGKRTCLTSFRWSSFLEGGVGGLCSGYAFGVHFSTFLALLIPNTSSSAQIGPKAFIALWVLSATPCILLAGRWKYAAIILAGVTGYASLALALSVIMHPALLTRIVLTAVFVPIGTILCLLPRFTRIALRIACASMGSFGIVLAIALLAHIPAWGDVWERYWIHDGSDWGTSKEKGLSAAFCLLFSTGLASDWFIHSKFGENPDEKWDRYLANYTASLPNDRGRAGTFTPAISLWDRIFGNHRALAPIVQDVLFPTDADLKLPHPSPGQVKLSKQRSVYDKHTLPDLLDAKPRIGFLRKKGTTRVPGAKRNRRAIKFRPLDEEEGLSSSDEDSPLQEKPWKLTTSLSSASTVTLTNSRKVDFEGEKDMDLKPPKRNEIPEYSDYEDDIGNVGKRVVGRDGPNWTPEFIRRHSTRSNQSRSKPSPTASPSPSNTASQRTVVERQGTPTTPSTSGVPFAAVPATPSLIRAVDRITAAHEALYRSQTSDVGAVSPARETTASPPGDRQQRDKAWDSFWTEVKAKARS